MKSLAVVVLFLLAVAMTSPVKKRGFIIHGPAYGTFLNILMYFLQEELKYNSPFGIKCACS